MLPLKCLPLIAILALSILPASQALAHAFPEQEIPGAGAELTEAPASVSIHFDSDLEPIFSKLIVKNDQGTQVSQSNGRINPSNPRTLKTSLINASKGVYHVYWSVITRDGHRTEGEYTFTVQ